jgi:hypothetical protein
MGLIIKSPDEVEPLSFNQKMDLATPQQRTRVHVVMAVSGLTLLGLLTTAFVQAGVFMLVLVAVATIATGGIVASSMAAHEARKRRWEHYGATSLLPGNGLYDRFYGHKSREEAEQAKREALRQEQDRVQEAAAFTESIKDKTTRQRRKSRHALRLRAARTEKHVSPEGTDR